MNKKNCFTCELSNIKDKELWCRYKKAVVKKEDCCNGYQYTIKEYRRSE